MLRIETFFLATFGSLITGCQSRKRLKITTLDQPAPFPVRPRPFGNFGYNNTQKVRSLCIAPLGLSFRRDEPKSHAHTRKEVSAEHTHPNIHTEAGDSHTTTTPTTRSTGAQPREQHTDARTQTRTNTTTTTTLAASRDARSPYANILNGLHNAQRQRLRRRRDDDDLKTIYTHENTATERRKRSENVSRCRRCSATSEDRQHCKSYWLNSATHSVVSVVRRMLRLGTWGALVGPVVRDTKAAPE